MGPTKSVCETHCIVIAEDKRSSQPNLDLVSGTLLTVYQDFSRSVHIPEILLFFQVICMVCEWPSFFHGAARSAFLRC